MKICKKIILHKKNLIYPTTRFLKSPKWYRTRIFDWLAGFLEKILYQKGSPNLFFPKVLYDPVQDLLAPRDVIRWWHNTTRWCVAPLLDLTWLADTGLNNTLSYSSGVRCGPYVFGKGGLLGKCLTQRGPYRVHLRTLWLRSMISAARPHTGFVEKMYVRS